MLWSADWAVADGEPHMDDRDCDRAQQHGDSGGEDHRRRGSSRAGGGKRPSTIGQRGEQEADGDRARADCDDVNRQLGARETAEGFTARRLGLHVEDFDDVDGHEKPETRPEAGAARLGPATGVLGSTELVVAVSMGWLFLGEPVRLRAVVGVAVMLTGAVLAAMPAERRAVTGASAPGSP